MTLGDEFGLAEHEFELALGDAAEALLDIDEFLGRHREKDDLAREVVDDLGVGQRHRRTQHPGDLRVMAATMRRTGRRIGERMLRGAQTVEFADQGEPRSRRAAQQTALNPGQRQAGARRQPERIHPLGNQSGGLDLVEPGLRVAQDGFAEIDDGVGVAVRRFAHGALQFVLAAHSRPRFGMFQPTCCLK